MDDLRIALLIAGIAVVAGIYAFTRFARRRSAKRRGDRDAVDSAFSFGDSDTLDLGSSLDSAPAGEYDYGDSSLKAVDDLGSVLVPRRDVTGAEQSVDVNILAGLRASWESTQDGAAADSGTHRGTDSGTHPGTDPGAPSGTEPEALAPSAPQEGPASGPAADTVSGAEDDASTTAADVPAAPVPDAARPPASEAQPLSIDMSRPLVYLTLVAKDDRLSGRAVLDALAAHDFLPGLMQLYYRRSDHDPSVVVGVANMIESGALDPEALPEIDTPGLVPFMGVPDDPAQALETFNLMIGLSRQLARALGATLCDETRSTLTAQAENHMRENVARIARRTRVQG